MERPGAREILQALIHGFDPLTGEELPPGTVLQKAEVIRALLAGVAALESGAARAQRRAHLPENVGRPWTPAEEQQLIKAFRAGDELRAIACAHRRTLNAIEARLERLGMLAPEQRVTRNRFLIAGPGARSNEDEKRDEDQKEEGEDS